MRNKEFCIGIPIYSQESLGLIHFAIKNIKQSEGFEEYNPPIILAINGPNSDELSKQLKELFDVVIIKSLPGVAQASRALARYAIEKDFHRIVLTDLDIYRFPCAISNLHKESRRVGDKTCLIYGNYSAYPIEVLEAAGYQVEQEEKLLWRIFQADKHPLIRPFVKKQREKRFKSSLVIGNPRPFLEGLSCQNITTDSVIAGRGYNRYQLHNAAFFHHGRFDLLDYIYARFRHIKAAINEGRFNTTYYRQEVIYTPNETETIAKTILSEYPESKDHEEAISFFLIQSALRHVIYNIGRHLFLYDDRNFLKKFKNPGLPIEEIIRRDITNFSSAEETVEKLIGLIADKIDPFSKVTTGVGITQEKWRLPVDCQELINQSPYLRGIIHAWLGLANEEKI
ncbi:MAG: hypothetical protein N2482_00620 [Patescibacteria group bacterium]|nr:hypothetical protein [Patescibacteria group bacterium]